MLWAQLKEMGVTHIFFANDLSGVEGVTLLEDIASASGFAIYTLE